MHNDAERKRALSRVPTSFGAVAVVSTGWLLFYAMLALHGSSVPYEKRLAKAWATEEQMNGSRWASVVHPLLMPVVTKVH